MNDMLVVIQVLLINQKLSAWRGYMLLWLGLDFVGHICIDKAWTGLKKSSQQKPLCPVRFLTRSYGISGANVDQYQ
jgi:hypothetical protein